MLRTAEIFYNPPNSVYNNLIGLAFRKEIREFEEKVEKLICDYAIKAYDILYLIKTPSSKSLNYNGIMENEFIKLMEEKQMSYSIIIDDTEQSFNKLINEIKYAMKK